jgi:hypothetical protein
MAMTRKSRWAGMKLVVSSPFFFINSYRSADTICVPSSKFISLQSPSRQYRPCERTTKDD